MARSEKSRYIVDIVAIAIVLILFTSFSFAQEAVRINPKGLSWDKVTDNDLAGYRIHYGNETGNYNAYLELPLSDIVDTENPIFDINYAVATDGHYYYAVTAYDEAGNESGYSNEVNFIIDKSSPEDIKNLRLIDGISIIINIGN
jgi:fibronectin type 3 domain-containing protein